MVPSYINLGLLIFVDEADAFLRRRAGDELISENLRNAINTFLYRTGTPTTKFMIVLATNTPELLDEALQDRMDEMVYFEKPSIKQRADILNYYLLKYLKPKHSLLEKMKMILKHPSLIYITKKDIKSELSAEYIDEVANRTEGFSARELSKLVIGWHDEAFAKENPVLDTPTANKVVDKHIIQNKVKDKWNTTQHEYFKLMHSKI
jgi:ATPase family AAA domain-containing protein 3A/B